MTGTRPGSAERPMRDRIEYWREQLAGIDDLSSDHENEFTIRRRQPAD